MMMTSLIVEGGVVRFGGSSGIEISKIRTVSLEQIDEYCCVVFQTTDASPISWVFDETAEAESVKAQIQDLLVIEM
jgi:hypothetical protein